MLSDMKGDGLLAWNQFGALACQCDPHVNIGVDNINFIRGQFLSSKENNLYVSCFVLLPVNNCNNNCATT